MARERNSTDSFEEWLERQSVKSTKRRAERKLPRDSYELWLEKEVKRARSGRR